MEWERAWGVGRLMVVVLVAGGACYAAPQHETHTSTIEAAPTDRSVGPTDEAKLTALPGGGWQVNRPAYSQWRLPGDVSGAWYRLHCEVEPPGSTVTVWSCGPTPIPSGSDGDVTGYWYAWLVRNSSGSDHADQEQPWMPIGIQVHDTVERINRVYAEPIDDTEAPAVLEEVEMPSELMAGALGRQWSQWAIVARPRALPPDTPVLFVVDGFRASSAESRDSARSSAERWPSRIANAADEFGAVLVYPDVCVDGGHHGFADSETNGPVGTMLTREFIPWLDDHLGLDPTAAPHYVMGHSSGGWATANLLMRFPGVFDGGLGTSPDPVDFRDFHGINLYVDESAFLTRDGLKPVFGRDVYKKKEGKPPVTFDQIELGAVSDFFPKQMAAYEAAFSPVDADGVPRKLFDRETGVIDREVADWWIANHDLAPLLATRQVGDLGKLALTCGVQDEFGLHRPLRLFADRAASTTTISPEAIQFFPGGHFGSAGIHVSTGLDRLRAGEEPFAP